MNQNYWMYLSLWNEHGGAPGLALLSTDIGTGQTVLERQLNSELSFGCSCVDQRRNILYICNEVEKVWGVPYETGRIYGYRISPADGSLTQLFAHNTLCPNPAFVSQDPSGRFLLVAHHSMGGALVKLELNGEGKFEPVYFHRDAPLIVYALNEDGTIGDIVDVQKHPVSPDSKPYGTFQHCCVFSPDGKFVAVCDKGDGCLYLYSFNSETGKLTLCSRTQTDVPGSHPRYCVFHPTRPYLIVNHEQERNHRMMVSSFRYTQTGQVEPISAVNLLDDGDAVPPGSHYEQQGIAISEDGATVYTCVNGPNFVGVLSVDDNGALALIQKAPIAGEWPRGLAMAPGGKTLFASCLVSGEVISFPVNAGGTLAPGRCVGLQKGGSYISFFQRS